MPFKFLMLSASTRKQKEGENSVTKVRDDCTVMYSEEFSVLQVPFCDGKAAILDLQPHLKCHIVIHTVLGNYFCKHQQYVINTSHSSQ